MCEVRPCASAVSLHPHLEGIRCSTACAVERERLKKRSSLAALACITVSLLALLIAFFGWELSSSLCTAQPHTKLEAHSSEHLTRQLEELDESGALSRWSQEPLWRRLLHYEEGMLRGESRSDGERFFLSQARTPLAELKADLVSLYTSPQGPDEHFSCRFPARATWLLKQAQGRLGSPPTASCPQRDQFLKKMDIYGVELVYASASFTQSASMFGHTMLRIIRDPNAPRLSDPMTSFVAFNTVSGLGEVIYGLTSQFVGVIEVSTFLQQLINYTVRERRHLWSFKLKVPQEGLQRLVAHLWEMNSTFFYYNFVDENCAFYNQQLLQVALPERDILSGMSWVSLPIEAVQAITQYPDLIEQVTFYPSAHRVAERGWDVLNPLERELALSLLTSPRQLSLPKERAALVYKTALHISLLNTYRVTLKVSAEESANSEALTKLLMNTGLDPALAQPDHTNPTVGLGPHSFTLATGLQRGGAHLIDVELRPLLHGWEEVPLSYELHNEVTLLKTRGRYLSERQRFKLQQITLAALYNMRPWSLSRPLFSTPPSWAFDLGLRDAAHFRRQLDAYAELSWGLTLPLASLGGLSLMVGPVGEVGLKGEARWGLHGFAQITLYPHLAWSLSARGGARHFKWNSLTLDTQELWAEVAINSIINRHLSWTIKGRATSLVSTQELTLNLNLHWF